MYRLILSISHESNRAALGRMGNCNITTLHRLFFCFVVFFFVCWAKATWLVKMILQSLQVNRYGRCKSNGVDFPI